MRMLLLALLMPLVLAAQNTGAPGGAGIPNVASLPGTCTVGGANTLVFLTTGTTGLYQCGPANTFTAVGGGGTPSFSAITPGTNTGALNIGSGGSLGPTGTGTIQATIATTQAATDNSTNPASTAYVTTAIANAVNAAAGRDLVIAATAAVLPNTPTFTHVDSGIGSFLTSSTNSALVVDGYTAVLNDRILVKNEAAAANNGIYKLTQLGVAAVTPWILTRALDYDQPSDMNNTIVPVANNGTANPKTSWIMTATVATVDTDAVNFTAFTPNGANIVTASSPGIGIGHFAGSTQTVTSSAVNLAGGSNEVTGVLPTANIAVALANQTSINGLGITASTGALTIPNGVTLTGPSSSGTVMALNQTNTLTSAGVIDASAASTTAGLKIPAAAGAVPTADDFIAFNTTNHTFVWGSNGTTEVGAVAATGTGTATTCSNQVVSAISSLVAPTCHTVAGADFGSSVAARAGLNNATASVAAPTMSTTADFLSYQVAEIPQVVFMNADFTTSGVGTALEAITGLSWTLPGSTALNVSFSCHLIYHQNSAFVAVAFGTQNATTAPTNYAAKGVIYTSATVFAAANVVANTSTSAVSIVSATPSAITTNWNADLDGLIEQPSGTASVFTIRVSTATAGDTVTVKRGSFCRVN